MGSKNLYTITATVRIKKGQGRTLKAGGAWIYDNEIDAITGEFQNGNLCPWKTLTVSSLDRVSLIPTPS